MLVEFQIFHDLRGEDPQEQNYSCNKINVLYFSDTSRKLFRKKVLMLVHVYVP